MKKINLQDYYPYFIHRTAIVEVRLICFVASEYMIFAGEPMDCTTYRYKAFYSLDRDRRY